MSATESQAPIFPHEDIVGFKSSMEQSNPDLAYEIGQAAVFLKLHMQISGPLDPATCSRAFAAANGEVHAGTFSNKYQFGDLVNQMGYTAPRSVVVEPKGIENSVDYYDRIVSLDEQQPQRFCKPLYSTRGRGARMFESSEAALAFAKEQDEPYLVQTFERPQREWRYVLHRDAFQLSNGERPGWRIAYEKLRPTVTGDGRKSIAEFIKEYELMPARSKRGYLKHHKGTLATVPAYGEVVELIQASNVALGAYTQLPSDVEIRNLDRFMAQFLDDVEAELGTRLGTLCVDLGAKDAEALLGEYDHDRIKRSLVFYEHQMPFDVVYDVPPQYPWGAADKYITRTLRAKYVHRQIYVSLMRSVVRSGRLLREQSAE